MRGVAFSYREIQRFNESPKPQKLTISILICLIWPDKETTNTTHWVRQDRDRTQIHSRSTKIAHWLHAEDPSRRINEGEGWAPSIGSTAFGCFRPRAFEVVVWCHYGTARACCSTVSLTGPGGNCFFDPYSSLDVDCLRDGGLGGVDWRLSSQASAETRGSVVLRRYTAMPKRGPRPF